MIPVTEVELMSGVKVLVDDDFYIILKSLLEKRYYSIGRYGKNKKYAVLNIRIPLHHLVVGLNNLSDEQVVDHKNRNPLDNRRDNLRICTKRQNNINKDHPRKDFYKGVYKIPSGRYQAKIGNTVNGTRKQICIGTYDTSKEAAIAYNKKAFELHGEFANLNVI